MATTQIIPIGAADFVRADQDRMEWSTFPTSASPTAEQDAVLITPALLSAANRDRRLWPGLITLGSFSVRNRILFYITDGTESLGSGAGEDLSDAWETSTLAITIRSGAYELVIGGPRSDRSAGGVDAEAEPYSWQDSGYVNFRAFVTGYNGLTQAEKDATVLILSDIRGTDYIFSGRATTGIPVLSATLEEYGPPQVFCLASDPGRSIVTEDPLLEPERGIKIFLEISPRIDLFRESLVVGTNARPLIDQLPEITSDSSLFGNVGEISFTMDNTDGEFSNDMVGQYMRLWGYSYPTKRQLFLGQIIGQQNTLNETIFTASDLPL